VQKYSEAYLDASLEKNISSRNNVRKRTDDLEREQDRKRED
jgi:hypothetical protein